MIMKPVALAAEDREFLRLVERSAFGNPFSREREGLEREIIFSAHTDRPGAGDAPRVVRERLERFAGLCYARLSDFGESEQSSARAAFLYDAFHRVIQPFDALIEGHAQGVTSRGRITFADEAIAGLQSRGFSPEESAHFLAIFYQLRRAYYFIARGLVGGSAVMQALRMRLWANVFTHDMVLYTRRLWSRMEDFSTLLLGATGSGKGACAAAIGRSGYIPYNAVNGDFADNFQRCFTSINLSQYSGALIESELFGHKKGAFTGALQSSDGLFDRCSPYGGIFLDEIGELSPALQIKLLTVLQDRVFSPVGSRETHRFEGRVIAATNRRLSDLRGQGGFREDFYYRLCSDVISVPGLAERLREDPDELIVLVSHVVRRLCGVHSGDIAPRVLEALGESTGSDYGWPGNVRELEQAVRRILLTGSYASLPSETGDVDEAWLGLDAEGVLARYCSKLYDRLGSYEAAGRRAGLDRRTVKKYVTSWAQAQQGEG